MALTGSGQISFNDVRIETSQSIKAPYEMGNWTWGGGSPTIVCSGIGYTGYAPINVLSSGSEFCKNYSLYLSCGGPASADYNYLDCGGVPISSSFDCGTTVYFNAKNGSVNHPSPVTVLTDLGSTLRFSESSPLLHQNLSMSAWYSYDHNLYIGLDITGTLYQHADANSYCYPSTMLIVDVGTTNTTLSINISGTQDNGSILGVFYGKPWNNDGSTKTITSIIFGNGDYPTITSSFDYNYEYNSDSGSKLYFILANACP